MRSAQDGTYLSAFTAFEVHMDCYAYFRGKVGAGAYINGNNVDTDSTRWLVPEHIKLKAKVVGASQ